MNIPKILAEKARELETYYAKAFPALAPLVSGCFLSTIETTVEQQEDGSFFVITGDIPAMWLRDSTFQVMHYVPYAAQDDELAAILESIIRRHARQVLSDPYANAFNKDNSDPARGHKSDLTEHFPCVWERKYEIDSLCAPIYLAHAYWKATGKTGFFDETWKEMGSTVVRVFRLEQDHSRSSYSFFRRPGVLSNDGKGSPVGITGMTWTAFRPSDDACMYHYLIPANMMAVRSLELLSEIAEHVYRDGGLCADAQSLAQEIRSAILKWGVFKKEGFGSIYAYEVDGLGHANFMDDANAPSLLSIPYLGYSDISDPLYQNTRRFILSKENPYYYEGTSARGIGSPHTPENYIWHIGLLMQALTSSDREEILSLLNMVAETHAGTNVMHESFDKDDPEKFTRPWFAWANSLFAALTVKLMDAQFFG